MGRKWTIEDMHRIAEERGGECLSNEYINNHTKLRWKCKKDHPPFEKAPKHIINRNQWCPKCSKIEQIKKSRKYSIQDMQEIAKSRNGECLSKEYVSSSSKLQWKCKEGHIWWAIPNNVIRRSWCPICAKNVPLTIDEMHVLAKTRNGKCLSIVYINSSTPLLWECSKGHQWEANPNSIKRGSWCLICSGSDKKTIEEAREFAKKKRGKCLSNQYKNANTKMKWECKSGHMWDATFSSLINMNTWCPYCIGRGKTIDDMHNLASIKEGKCLSKEYHGKEAHLEWECKNKHTWFASPNNVRNGHWCPICSSGISEKICRKMFETLFETSFPKSHPKWLRNKRTGKLMELDGYNQKLKFAFEYQGKQHYEFNKHFHKTMKGFELRLFDDQLKRELCMKNNVNLIEIPYYILYDEMVNYIINECKKNGYPIPKLSLDLFDYRTFDGIFTDNRLKELQDIAEKKGGRCLSKRYVNSHTKLIWECSEGHIWETNPYVIKNGHWCPRCRRKRRKKKK